MHVKWIGRGDHEGYGIAGREYVRFLAQHGIRVTWSPRIAHPDHWDVLVPGHVATDDPVLLAALAEPEHGAEVAVVHLFPTDLPPEIDHERRNGRRVVCYVVWETDHLPTPWVETLNRCDAVLVPCTWNAEVFAAGGVSVPIHVLPHLPPSVRATEDDRRRLLARLSAQDRARLDRARTVYYSIGTYSRRKGIDLVVRAFCTAFAGRDDVVLVLKTSREDNTRWIRGLPLGWYRWRPAPTKTRVPAARSVARLRRGVRRAPDVVVIAEQDLGDGEIAALHELGEVYLALPRSEGWGLGGFEAALHARPVVMTAATGQLDYLDADLAYGVRSSPVRAEEKAWGIDYRPDDLWAEADLAHAVELLREVDADLATARARAERLAERLHQRFGPDAMLARLREALGEPGQPGRPDRPTAR